MKKIVMFNAPIHPIPPVKGAAVESWIDEVSKKVISYQIHIISLSSPFLPLKEYKNGVYYHRIYLSRVYKRIFQKILGWDVYSYNKRVFNVIKNINPDIVHIHNYYESKEIIYLIRKFNPNIKIILHMHNESDKFLKNPYPKVDAFIGCSNYIKNSYKNVIKSDLFKTIYNGVDSKKFKNIEDFSQNIKSILKKKEDEINICYFGRISPEKGVDKFVKLANLFKNNGKYKFHCFGEISKSGDRRNFYNNLIEYIKINKLNNIIFYDFIPPQKMYLAYNFADFVIVPSQFNEPFGMVALEALAAKKIVIAAKKGGLVEFLNDKNSFLIDNYNEFEYLAKDIILNSKKLEGIQEEALKTADQYDWFNIAFSLERFYNEL
jgi:UDP-glucose:(glucosyl)LPS alpha-1,2-glucosyltransferase